MDTYLVKPGESFTIHRKQYFYSAQAMISLKATNLSYPERNSGASYRFQVFYKNLNGFAVSFELKLEAPYYMALGSFIPNSEFKEPSEGPFNMVEVKSENNIPIVLQVSFTDRLA